jgi:hypothetical protein
MFKSALTSLLLFCTLLTLPLGLAAEEGEGLAQKASAAGPLLKAGDIDHIIKTLPALKADLEALGEQFVDFQNPSQMQAMAVNEKVQAVFKRHNWDSDAFASKISALMGAFAKVKLDQELENLPAEQRQMMASMLQGQLGDLVTAHPQDVALVRAKMAQLESFFDSMSE